MKQQKMITEQHEIAEVEATPRHAHDRGDGIIEQFTEPDVTLPRVAEQDMAQQFRPEPDADISQ